MKIALRLQAPGAFDRDQRGELTDRASEVRKKLVAEGIQKLKEQARGVVEIRYQFRRYEQDEVYFEAFGILNSEAQS